MSKIHSSTLVVANQLNQLAAAPGTSRLVAEVARERLARIEAACSFLENRSHRIAFVGHIGAGKSAMIGVLAKLLVGDTPTDKTTLKENSILAVGAGGTTVCEVQIRAASSAESGRIALLSEPLTLEEMRREIELFAQDEWARRHLNARKAIDDERDPTPREVQRVIRNMTSLPERQETIQEGGQKKRRTVDPLDDVVSQHDSARSLANFLVEKAGLMSRRERSWWWDATHDGFLEMKRRFDEINNGRIATAMLPKRLTLVVPNPLPDSAAGLELELIDTRGFDGQLEARADIQAVLRDPRCLVVVCTHFKEAPSDNLRTLLRSIQADVELRVANERMLILLMDHGDGEQVNGANGDREGGQEIKLQECRRALDGLGLEMFAKDGVLRAFDALRDDRLAVIRSLDALLSAYRGAVATQLDQEVRDGTTFLGGLDRQRVDLARQKVDSELVKTFAANRPSGVPLRDPLEGLYSGIRDCRWASQVLATCRRSGEYSSMDVYAAVRWGASAQITEWLDGLNVAMKSRLRTLEQDPDFVDVADHIRFRRTQYTDGYLAVIRRYADGVRDEVWEILHVDPVWDNCAHEWGRGSGFKERVITHLTRWSRMQALEAHEDPAPAGLLPLLRNMETAQE
jgi:hypothetical protein